jgi:hypothetical protein
VEDQDDQQDDIHERLVEDLRADRLRRDHNLGKLAWYGAHDAPLVQRIGVCLIASVFIGLGLACLDDAITEKRDALPMGIMSMLVLYGGTRIFRNGLLRRSRPPEDPK